MKKARIIIAAPFPDQRFSTEGFAFQGARG